ncbi:MAG: hypothetical protein FJX71_04020 [Alphaproteobacteria bacterium]|nr:hypothetical protein [Alphaproteobacteria bacterium]
MIQLYGPDNKTVNLFKDYEELYKHITALENSKLSEENVCLSHNIWSFALYTNKRLSYIYYKTLERSFSKVGKEAFEQELDLIEICKGDYESPIQIPVTADVNVNELRKNWCQEYCETHDYVLVDRKSTFDTHPIHDTISVANTVSGSFGKEQRTSA